MAYKGSTGEKKEHEILLTIKTFSSRREDVSAPIFILRRMMIMMHF